MQRMGYTFRDPMLLENALTHSSYANEGKRGLKSNERLEFLGDSVLGFITAGYLFRHGSGEEGELTRLRASLVCEKALCVYAKKLGLGEALLLGRGEIRSGGANRPSILADAFEAVIAAIYLDGGYSAAEAFVLPYIKEELYGSAMSEYIDQIIRQVENFDSQPERLNFIRNQLAFKRLFSVIVTNMDAIKLTLYKRERMKEQSRYLKYEEAVGSTGQSQGIYIQFLVAIINYISSINSGNADPLDLKKVIFIDNPFGAAKDVYIWEPIFKLLKSNNVQLVVPARGATPAITGHFEVNYILGQKLIDGRVQTVVVDYRSQTEEKELEYAALEYEQESFSFL